MYPISSSLSLSLSESVFVLLFSLLKYFPVLSFSNRRTHLLLNHSKCDQMAVLTALHLAIYTDENLPNGIENFAKLGLKFCQLINKP